jgi:putative ABC transport system permease protein
MRWRTRTLTGGERAESAWAHEVTEGFFSTAGVGAAHGRTLGRDDFSPGAPRAVVLSDRLWRARYAADPALVGRTIQIDGAAVPVVGIMPPGFYPMRFGSPDLWLPYWPAPGDNDNRVTWSFITLARLKPGVTFEQAHREMDLISDRLTAAYPLDYDNMSAVLVPVTGEVVSSYETLFYTLLGAVGLVLLVGCVNVANLMLARAVERGPEFSIRAALGAPRRRLIRQLLTESVLLSGAGGLLGLVVARLALPAALTLLPADSVVPRMDEVALDWAVLAFTLVVSVFAGVLFGLVPALRASKTDLNEGLKEAGRGAVLNRRAKRLGDLLVIGEVALSLLLLVGAGLLLRSFLRLQAVESGFDTQHVLAMQLTVPTHRYGVYELGGANPSRAALYRELARRVGEVPGVQAAAVTALLPLRHGPNPWSVTIEGRGAPSGKGGGDAARSLRTGLYPHGSISIERVTPDYFRTMGIRLVRGRLIEDRDTAGSLPVTVVSETFVRKFFPDEDPMGRRITVDMTSYFPKLTIVGVVADNRMHGLDRDPYPLLYWPMAQLPNMNGWLIVRAHGAPENLTQAVREAVASVDGDVAITNVATMRTVAADSMWRPRFTTFLFGVFAGLALLLAAAGIYAVISYSVSQRTQEMGVRVTLGAAPHEILRLIVGHTARLAVAGVLIGIIASLALRTVLRSQLFGVSPSDPATIAAVSSLLLLVAVLASAVPAWRALRADPVTALRQS